MKDSKVGAAFAFSTPRSLGEKPFMLRRHILATAAASFAAPAIVSRGSLGQNLRKVKMGSAFTTTTNAAFLMPDILKPEGIDLELVMFPSLVQRMQAVASGDVDIGNGGLSRPPCRSRPRASPCRCWPTAATAAGWCWRSPRSPASRIWSARRSPSRTARSAWCRSTGSSSRRASSARSRWPSWTTRTSRSR